MSVLPRTVAEVLNEHVTLQVEAIDRMYLNVYVPRIQSDAGAAAFFRFHRGHQFASTALMSPMTVAFVAQIEQFVEATGVNLIAFDKGARKDDIALKYLKDFHADEGVLFVGKAQEKAWVFRSERRKNAETGKSYAWIVRTTAMVNQYYFYCVDRDFGPFFLKFCSYFPYTALTDVRRQTSDDRHQTSDDRHQTSDDRHQTSDVRHQTSDVRLQQPRRANSPAVV
jgi:hypothetical protein